MSDLRAATRLLILSAVTVAVCLAAQLLAGCSKPPVRVPPSTSSTTTTSSSTTTSSTTTSSTSTTSTTTLPPGDWSCPEVIRLAKDYWPAEQLPTVDRVAWRESRCDPTAANLSYLTGGRDQSLGLFQINVLGTLWADRAARCQLSDPAELFDPVTNVRCAHILWIRSGWAPWGL